MWQTQHRTVAYCPLYNTCNAIGKYFCGIVMACWPVSGSLIIPTKSHMGSRQARGIIEAVYVPFLADQGDKSL